MSHTNLLNHFLMIEFEKDAELYKSFDKDSISLYHSQRSFQEYNPQY